jgi:hypothetical protein
MSAIVVQIHRHKPEVAASKLGWRLLDKREVRGDRVQAPGFVTLCHTGGRLPEYVAHFFNSQDGGFHNGQYASRLTDGQQLFLEKVLRYTRHHKR